MRCWVAALVLFGICNTPVFAQSVNKFLLEELEKEQKTPEEPTEDIDLLLEGFDDEPSKEKDSGGKKTKPTDSVDMLLEGFDDSPSIEVDVEQVKEKEFDWLSFGGYMSLSQSINYQHGVPAEGKADFRGLSRLRYKISPEAEANLPKQWKMFASGSGFYDAAFYANGREQYRETYLDEYEKELELREFWLAGTIGSSLDIKLGRQIVVWGKSDSIRVVDVLNPLDMREPGMVDIEDLRLPVTMARVDYFFGNWSISTIVVPELRRNKIPVEGSDFYPASFAMVPEDLPENWKNPEFAAAISGVFSGWDLSFHAASTYEDQAHFEKTDTGMRGAYSRINMLGFAENMVKGSWLFKLEYAVFNGLKYFSTGENTFWRGDLIAGVDYSGITDHSLSFESLWSNILNYDSQLQQLPDDKSKHSGQLAIRYTGNFMRETLQVVVLASIFGFDGSDGGFYRASAKYMPGDGLSITAGVMVYQSGDWLFLKSIARNDRVFAEARYDF